MSLKRLIILEARVGNRCANLVDYRNLDVCLAALRPLPPKLAFMQANVSLIPKRLGPEWVALSWHLLVSSPPTIVNKLTVRPQQATGRLSHFINLQSVRLSCCISNCLLLWINHKPKQTSRLIGFLYTDFCD